MDSAMLIALKLARDGYGTPVEILEMPTDIVLAAAQHSQFVSDYQTTYYKLNRKDTK